MSAPSPAIQIQIAKHLGAQVATPASPRGDALVRRLGADVVMSVAGMPEPETARRDLGRGSLLAALFWFASLGTRRAARGHSVRYRYLFMHPSGSDLPELAALIDAKKLEVVVDRISPFAEAKEALAHLEGGTAKGKVVVRMPS